MSYQDENAAAIERWIESGWEWGKPISHEDYIKAKAGDWSVVLTPKRPVPRKWFGNLSGKKLLGLASGGGQQIPVFCAAGAECTVFDYTPKQLESEKLVAEREGYSVNIVRGDMTKPLPFLDESFDIIFFPVSNCYIEEAKPVFAECFRVLKKGGSLLSGLDNGFNYAVDNSEKAVVNSFPYNPLKNPEQMKQLNDDDSGIQFSHTAEEQLGGQLEAGFTLTDILEDTNGEGWLQELNIPTFWLTRAVKR